ncbi:MAG: LptA/OstA family protein [Halanaerobiaceae bacterium]
MSLIKSNNKSLIYKSFHKIFNISNVLILFLLLFILSAANNAAAPTSSVSQQQGIWADSITTSLVNEDTIDSIVAEGSALLRYNDIEVTSDYIEYNMGSEDVFISGNVDFHLDNYRLQAEELSGNLADMTLSARDDVIFSGEELRIMASSVSFDESKEEVVFTGETSLKYREIQASADTLIYNYQNEVAYLEGNVISQQNGLRLSGSRLEIDLESEKVKLLGQAELLFEEEAEEGEEE